MCPRFSDLYPFNSGYGVFAGWVAVRAGCPAQVQRQRCRRRCRRYRPRSIVPLGLVSARGPAPHRCVRRAALGGHHVPADLVVEQELRRIGLHPATARDRRAEPREVPYGAYTLKVAGTGPAVSIPITASAGLGRGQQHHRALPQPSGHGLVSMSAGSRRPSGQASPLYRIRGRSGSPASTAWCAGPRTTRTGGAGRLRRATAAARPGQALVAFASAHRAPRPGGERLPRRLPGRPGPT